MAPESFNDNKFNEKSDIWVNFKLIKLNHTKNNYLGTWMFNIRIMFIKTSILSIK
jgi:hypothetical protein